MLIKQTAIALIEIISCSCLSERFLMIPDSQGRWIMEIVYVITEPI